MLNNSVEIYMVDSRTLVGARFIEIHIYDIMRSTDVPLLVELIRSHFLAIQDIRLDEAVHDIHAFFSSRQYAARVEKTLSEFNFVLAMNMLGQMEEPNLSLRIMENREITDIHMWENGALSDLQDMLC